VQVQPEGLAPPVLLFLIPLAALFLSILIISEELSSDCRCVRRSKIMITGEFSFSGSFPFMTHLISSIKGRYAMLQKTIGFAAFDVFPGAGIII
jgi:hypothetical protein